VGTYFITGSTGYIGKPLTSRLKNAGNSVVALSRNYEVVDEWESSDHVPEEAHLDLRERKYSHLGNIGISGATVVDLAWDFANESQSDQIKDHISFAKAAIELGAARIVSIGTLFELGFNQGLIDEQSPRLGDSPHGKAKTELFHSLTELLRDNPQALLWPRLHYVLGRDVRSRSVFGKIERSHEPFIINPREGKFDFIELDNLIDILVTILHSNEFGAIDVGSGNPQTFHEKLSAWLLKKGLNPKDYLRNQDSDHHDGALGTWPALQKLDVLLGPPHN
jgi:nucleoside-diphosphate-sugar epimerase